MPHSARYSLLALDLDGTLLDPAGRISQANREAVASARDAGITVAVCTGRGLVECQDILKAIDQTDPVVVAGGSIVADPVIGSTLHRFPVNLEIVRRSVETLTAHGHAALVFKDADAAGYDYLVVTPKGEAGIDPVSMWWFKQLAVRIRIVGSLGDDEHPEHTVRVGVCAPAPSIGAVAAELREALGERAILHVYPAVIHEAAPGEPVYDAATALGPAQIVEVFDPAATKWTGVSWLAGARGIPLERIAAIGDQVNDLPMIVGAGLGIAMGNAIPAVGAAAKRQTLDNASDGVAHAVGMILRGEW